MTTLRVTITADVPLPDGAVEQAKATLSIYECLSEINKSLQEMGASCVAETLDFKSGAGRKRKATVAAVQAD